MIHSVEMAEGGRDDTRKGDTSSSSSQRGMRKSCNACGLKKRRCDGRHPCSRCMQSALQCEYSKRKWHQPEFTQRRQQRRPKESNRDEVHILKDPIHPVQVALVERRMLPFKRCRLRASPATGLVGMPENAFINEFFGCVGFLPLTDESLIREAMVKIMVRACPRQEAGFGTDCCGEEGPLGAVEGGRTFGNVSGAKQLANDPSFCTFWCAVALGALSKGRPIESVERYCELARETLAASQSSSTDVELAKASAILTYLYCFMGDLAKFRESLDLSESLVRASIEKGSMDIQTGLPDLILQCRKVNNVMNESTGSMWTQEQPLPQLGEVATESELYRFIAQSSRAFDQAIYAKFQEQCPSTVEDIECPGPHSEGSPPCNPHPKEVWEATVAVLDEGNFPEFESLQAAAERPRIRDGIGGLLINGALVFEKGAKGDLDAALKSLDCSVEVFERYPGLCRCMLGSHMSHMLLAVLAKIGNSRAGGMYTRLRRVHNHFRLPRCVPIPPLDEWHGIAAICSNLHCRVIEDVLSSEHMNVFATSSVDSVHDSAALMKTASSLHGQAESKVLSSGFTHGGIGDAIAAYPRGSTMQFNAARERSPAHKFVASCADVNVAPPASSSHRRRPPDTWFYSAVGAPEIAAVALEPWTLSTGVDRDYQVIAGTGDNEIAAADWLEVAKTLSNAGHTS